MLLRMIYDDALAQAAYLIGCQATGDAIVIDPERDVDRYIDLAKREGLRIVAATETHVHADFLSGVRELAEQTGCETILSAEGGPDWQYKWLDAKSGGGAYEHRLVRDGDTFEIGAIRFRVVHTPGHTPEHICFEVFDQPAAGDAPMGLLTGDFVFVGDLGRPDLLESAAGQIGAMEPAAHELYKSVNKFLDLPDYLQVWPGHGAGSACGKALGAVPQSTVGYEKRFNAAIQSADTEDHFVSEILSGQPEPPVYFARMKRQNLEGPPVLGKLPEPKRIKADDLPTPGGKSSVVLDTRAWPHFRRGHVEGALSAPLDKSFPTIAGAYVAPEQSIILVAREDQVDAAVRALVRVGLDNVAAWIDPADLPAGQLIELPEVDALQARERHDAGDAFFLDVRRAVEFDEGHIPGAHNICHVRLTERLDEVPKDRPVYVNCRSGVRSARASALLQRAGYDVTNISGGYLAWEKAGGKVQQ